LMMRVDFMDLTFKDCWFIGWVEIRGFIYCYLLRYTDLEKLNFL